MNWIKEHKTTTWISVCVVVVVLIVAVLVYFHERGNKANAKEDSSKQQQKEPMRVKVVSPKEGGIERLVERPGTVQSFEYADLYANVSGVLENQKVDIGSRVKKGQFLAEVQAPQYTADVQKASADVNKAKADVTAAAAQVDKAHADVTVAESQFEQAKTNVTKAKATLVLREEQYDRFKRLVARKAIEQELLDEKTRSLEEAQAALAASQSAVATAKANIAAAKASVEKAKADRTDAEAQVGVAEAYLKRAKVIEGYTRITSPYTGVITKRSFHNGDFIRDAAKGGDSPMLAVARTDKMRVVIQAPDIDVPFLKVGDTVTLTIDTLKNDKEDKDKKSGDKDDKNQKDEDDSSSQGQGDSRFLRFTGKVARMAYSEVYETRTMRTEVDLENPVDEDHPNGILTNGMYGMVIIQLGREPGLRLPSTCLFGKEKKGDERSVFVVRDGRAHQVKVKIGNDDGIEVTIRQGLSASDQVVVERPPGLADKMQVEVLHDKSQGAKADKEETEKAKDPEKMEKTTEKKDKGKGKKK